jgi:hypothetical protein
MSSVVHQSSGSSLLASAITGERTDFVSDLLYRPSVRPGFDLVGKHPV